MIMNLKLVFTSVFSYVVLTTQAVAGGYDPCVDYPLNYGLWAILLGIFFILSLGIAKLFKFPKQLATYALMLLLSFILVTATVNIPFVRNYLEYEFKQKFECIFSSSDVSASEQSSETVEVPQQPHVYLREEFEALIVNKKQEEVLSLLGAPYSTSKNGGTEYWYYHETTIDPITKKADYTVQLIFELKDGYIVVNSVNFN